ncbi:hypothetical protein F2Q70_00032562 [Brassica cretica]|uniref:Phospholipase/carboxylesterase/thioesterase domain-containing protein n=1 Tax=Brassica cretica TaxID=69181 RepID=A0A8S9FF17_BRACR|nr:hypothetical protein F2Q70_00032562 [Brassica cretica]KAF3595105.1 hypothetical protein DY000_02026444 [Brassica cretica]
MTSEIYGGDDLQCGLASDLRMMEACPCSRSARGYEFGRTYVVRPKGKHQATIVWLHVLGDNGSSSSQLLESLPLPNVRIHKHKHLEVIFCITELSLNGL